MQVERHRLAGQKRIVYKVFLSISTVLERKEKDEQLTVMHFYLFMVFFESLSDFASFFQQRCIRKFPKYLKSPKNRGEEEGIEISFSTVPHA